MKVTKKQSAINRKLTKAYKEIAAERSRVCAGCRRSDVPLSHSHTISQKRCKEIGKPELIYDKNNIELMCFGTSESCHEIWEGSGNIKEKMKLKNFKKMMEFTSWHDAERFIKLTIKISA